MSKPSGRRHVYSTDRETSKSTREIDVYPCTRHGCTVELGMVRWEGSRSVNLRRYRTAPDVAWTTKIPPCG